MAVSEAKKQKEMMQLACNFWRLLLLHTIKSLSEAEFDDGMYLLLKNSHFRNPSPESHHVVPQFNA